MFKKSRFPLFAALMLLGSIILFTYFLRTISNNTLSPKSQESLNDINTYLKSQNQPLLSPQPIKQVSDQKLFNSYKDNNQPLILDIRESYELETSRLPDDFNVKYTRLGDLLSNNFEPIDKNLPIVIVSFGENRANQAALYLSSQGFSNISVLEGGISKWSFDNFPMAVNNYQNDKDISETLELIPPSDDRFEDSIILSFGPSSDPKNIEPIYWSSDRLYNYLRSLDTDRKYIISCNNRKDCYNALFFWHIAKSGINILGYTANLK